MKTTILYFLLMGIGLNQTIAQEEKKSASTSTWEINNSKENKKIKVKGEVRISDDDKSIAYLADGASISYVHGKDKLLVERDKKGRVQYSFNGEVKQSLDAKDVTFLRSAIKDLINNGLDAEARARRIYAKNGLNGLLQEVQELKDDYPRSLYLKSILGLNSSPSETSQLLEYSSRYLNSDYYKSETLNQVSSKSLQHEQVLDSYLLGASKIKSDYYKYTCLNSLINEMQISKIQQAKAIQVAQQIKSDYYQAELLKNILAKQSPNEAGYQETLKLLASIKSDYYKSEILSKLVETELNIAGWKILIAQVGSIKSDYYQAEVLQKITKRAADSEAIKLALMEAAKNIKSEHYYGAVMRGITAR